MKSYDANAYAPDGRPWWLQETKPGKTQRFGVTKRLAAYIFFNVDVNETIRMKDLRNALGHGGIPNADEHFNRRFRELRAAGWELTSVKEDSRLGMDEYRLVTVGQKIWLDGEFTKRSTISQRVRRQVFDRDNSTCQVCGIRAGESYPDDPGTKARMTVGHMRANALLGSVDLNNLRAECARCNEPMRDESSKGDGLEVIWPRIRRLSASDKTTVQTWLVAGTRPAAELLMIFDDVMGLSDQEKAILNARLKAATK